MGPRARTLLPWLAIACVVAGSLFARVWVRGPYYPGWDLVGASNGTYLLAAHGPAGAVAELWTQNRQYSAPFPVYSALGALLPAALTTLVPWDHWAHLVSLACMLAALALVARAAALDRTNGWIVLLAWSASPTLLTLAVSGYPWVTAFLPHALALWIVLDERFGRHPLLAFTAGLLCLEIAWHSYEPGRTAAAVFVVGAVLAPHASAATRVAWLTTGLTAVAFVFLHPTLNVGPYVRPDLLMPAPLVVGLRQVGRLLFVTRYLDLPMLVAAGALACLVPSRRRLLVAALFAMQVLLVATVAVAFPEASHLRPRRFVLVDGYALTLVALLVSEAAHGTRLVRGVAGVVVALLVGGSLWQVGDLVRFVRTPFDRGPERSVFTMPYSHSQADYMVNLETVDWAEDLIARVERGERLLLVYNLDAYRENITDPSGVLERLYVRVGHDRFVDAVLVFGAHSCRQSACLPIRPMTDVAAALDALRAAGPEALRSLTGFAVAPHPLDTTVFLDERQVLLDAIAAGFALHWQDPETATYRRFTLAPREAS
jgi:hypothetical protein